MFLLSSRRGGIEKAEKKKKKPELCPRPVAPATHSEAAKLYAQGYTQTHWYTHGFKSRKHTSSKATQPGSGVGVQQVRTRRRRLASYTCQASASGELPAVAPRAGGIPRHAEVI